MIHFSDRLHLARIKQIDFSELSATPLRTVQSWCDVKREAAPGIAWTLLEVMIEFPQVLAWLKAKADERKGDAAE